jgi:hypothetical protein
MGDPWPAAAPAVATTATPTGACSGPASRRWPASLPTAAWARCRSTRRARASRASVRAPRGASRPARHEWQETCAVRSRRRATSPRSNARRTRTLLRGPATSSSSPTNLGTASPPPRRPTARSNPPTAKRERPAAAPPRPRGASGGSRGTTRSGPRWSWAAGRSEARGAAAEERRIRPSNLRRRPRAASRGPSRSPRRPRCLSPAARSARASACRQVRRGRPRSQRRLANPRWGPETCASPRPPAAAPRPA